MTKNVKLGILKKKKKASDTKQRDSFANASAKIFKSKQREHKCKQLNHVHRHHFLHMDGFEQTLASWQ